MVAIISLLIVLTFSILITRIATVALVHTGLSREAARFQARSAFTGVGYTTNESESIVNHPVRRRIVLILMFLGNVGIVTAMSSLILGFVRSDSGTFSLRILLLAAGLIVLWGLGTSQWVDRRLSRLISWALNRYTRLEAKDYASLLRLAGDYRVTDLLVQPDDWLANRTLSELKLRDEGVAVLGITRKSGKYLGTPGGPTKVLPKDTLLLYGRASALENLDQRRAGMRGDREHDEAREKQEQIAAKEKIEDTSETPSDDRE
jgi:hypothetical protein